MKPNVDLLRRTLAHIEANPAQWEQGNWVESCSWPEGCACGTSHCFAGWAVVLSGASFAQDVDGFVSGRVVRPGHNPFDRTEWIDVAEYAAELLGLPVPDAPVQESGSIFGEVPELFMAENELDDLRRIVAELCEEAGS